MDIIKILKQKNLLCTGCEVCRNVCPNQAVEMGLDYEGFLYPMIREDVCQRCGLCEKTCPVLNMKYENAEHPESYAMMASDEERAESSSGAFVPMLAKWILSQHGVVFGAAWTNEWGVHQVAIESEEDLTNLRGLKYVQGRVEFSYQEAKKHIEDGRWVLYIGVPCQIAGLYAFLGNAHPENLVTVDILCHGMPSQKVFRSYLDDNYGISNIERFEHREKHSGWSPSATVYMKDGNIRRTSMEQDPYFRAFNPVMIQRPSCAQCPMSRLPRQGDITVGDFWGVERYRRELNDGKGTSAVLVNNLQGKKILMEIKGGFKLWESVPLEYITHINKTVLHPLQPHSGRKHFFSIINMKPFNESVERGLHHKYDIGVVGLWYGINYGSIITYYALYSILREQGYDAVMLPKPNRLWEEKFNSPDSIAQRFIWRHCNVFVPRAEQEQFRRFNDLCDDFVLGSDVVWMYSICGRNVDQFFFLDWVRHGHKKIAYAASLGSGLKGPDSYVKKAIRNLQRFDYISCRESAGVEELTKRTGRYDVVHVIDPVFLCKKELYKSIISESALKKDGNFVFAYSINVDLYVGASETINSVLKHCQATLRMCANPNEISRYKNNYSDVLTDVQMEDWLWYMQNCSYYIGDSFHALCFSLIFHRPFIIAFPDRSENSSVPRLESLLDTVGLKERLLLDLSSEKDKVEELLNKNIDWEDVDRRLERLKIFSVDWLKRALRNKPKEVTAEEYLEEERQEAESRLRQQVRNQESSLLKLNKLIERMELQISILTKKVGGNDVLRLSHYECALEITKEYFNGRKIVLYGDDVEIRKTLETAGLYVDCVVTGLKERVDDNIKLIYDFKGKKDEFYIIVPFLEYASEHIQRLKGLGYAELNDFVFANRYKL